MYYRPKEMVDEISDRVKRVASGTQLILGPETDEFETGIDQILFRDAARRSLLVSNGTVAIELVLRSLVAQSADPKASNTVLMPVMTVPMVKWAIERAGCVPVGIDIDAESHCMDVDKTVEMIRTSQLFNKRVFAVLFVYTGGLMPRNIKMLVDFCFANGVQFIEDVSHAYSTTRRSDGWVPGTKGDAVCGSLFATKTLSIGEGGFVRFNDLGAYQTARIIRHQGKDSRDVMVMDNCYNFRASEYAAAVGNVKLKYLDGEVCHRRLILDFYRNWVADRGFTMPDAKLEIDTGGYKAIVTVPDALHIELKLKRAGAWLPSAVHRDILFGGDFPVAKQVAGGHICLPLNGPLAAEDFIETWYRVFGEDRSCS